MDEAAIAAEATSDLHETLTWQAPSGTLARLLAAADAGGITLESLLGDAVDFYLDGIGA